MQEDSVWKEVLDAYFEDFLRFFFPEIHRDVDWRRGHEFLDKELEQLAPRGDTGRRYADKLVKVYLRDRGETWLLLHVEVQRRAGRAFAHRVYTYNYRIADRYRRSVVSLAVLTDLERRSRTGTYEMKRWGFEIRFRFPVVWLADYRGHEKSLRKERNPFAVVVLAHLARRQAAGADDLLALKVSLVRSLYERRYKKEDIIQLLRFVDWLLTLPSDLDHRFLEWFHSYQKEKRMPYVTSIERLAMERGEQKGRQEGRHEGLLEAVETALRVRFGADGLRLLRRVASIGDLEKLREIHERVLEASEIDEVAALVPIRSPRRKSR